ncbi:para-aminobenzoate synthetase [Promicromonospora sp. AC04]|uniref:anthranilate synthase component I family protein n=1 Tax=Promicromonospora sp. AC04 TaxID=2135723 RepID=UPI000D491C08|nr:anthranilate synthase component I family protein [Promicromonospora sp. AC04]PUB32289.1 para-aminobenzoate synthetase [Promicromonospora sp. AC04]
MCDDEAAIAYFREVAATHARCFWLDGAGGRDWSGRTSHIGWLADKDVSLSYTASDGLVRRHVGDAVEAVGTDIFTVLDQELACGPDDVEWVGYLGYAARSDLPARPSGDLPDSVWMRAGHVRRFEHPPAEPPGAGAVLPHPLETGREDAYRTAFARVREQLHAGNSYEVNLTYRVGVEADSAAVETYLALRRRNPAPYAGFLQHDVAGARAWVLSSSPERFVTIDAHGWAESRPIKGTTARGATASDDLWLRDQLADDPRFRAENLMIVDLIRNDLGTVSRAGTVSTPRLMEVESYASVHQLVSTVRGRLRGDVSTVAAIRALFPPGSMTGAPKLRTMQVIDEVEDTPRGVYSGAFGRVAASGEADLGVVIRSLVTDGSGRWSVGTGGGITVHSDVESELTETRVKATRLLDVLHRTDGDGRAIDDRLRGRRLPTWDVASS